MLQYAPLYSKQINLFMKIVITGSLGHISLPLTQQLVKKGHAVTVISSKANKQQDIEALGATAAIGALEDTDFLTATFAGADAVYCMIPPNNYFDHSLNLTAFYRRVGDSYAQAIKASGVKRVVQLSSVGAHLSEGSGLILAHHAVEGILGSLPDIAITHMRPTAFYYNLFGFVNGIKNTGVMASNYGAGDVVAWVSPVDIATAIAEELETPLTGRKVRYVASEEITCNQVATILGGAIGKPDLKWVVINDEQMQESLTAIGMGAKIVADMVEMNACMHKGKLFEDYNRHRPTLGEDKLTTFAKEFAAAYNKL
jgi:uncharacterized protein YbjT (DUF2867 family)